MVSKQKVLVFRPQQYNRRRRLKWWREHKEYVGELNYQQPHSLKTFKKQGWPRVYKIGQHLHYLACHAPKPINKRWYPAWKQFIKRYKKF